MRTTLLLAGLFFLSACGSAQLTTGPGAAESSPSRDAGATAGGSSAGGAAGGAVAGGSAGGSTAGGGSGGGTSGGSAAGGGAAGGGSLAGGTAGGGSAAGGSAGGGSAGGPSCTPTSCATGCCLNDTCQPGTQPLACGTTGDACSQCAALDACVAQRCGFSPTAVWRVQPTRAAIAATKPGGAAWDSFGGDPDVQVALFCPSTRTSASSTTPTVDNTYAPTWSSGACTATTAELLAPGFAFTVVDVDDFSGDDSISPRTTVTPTEAQLRAGTRTLTNIGSATSITFTFTRM